MSCSRSLWAALDSLCAVDSDWSNEVSDMPNWAVDDFTVACDAVVSESSHGSGSWASEARLTDAGDTDYEWWIA